jgi:predicted GNAT family acetyltransferase
MTEPKGDIPGSAAAALNVRDNREASAYEADVGGATAVAAYELDGDSIAFTHTEVPPEAEGQGVGAALVRYALDDVRARGLRVIPLCQFVRSYIRRHKEYADIVHPDWRTAVER